MAESERARDDRYFKIFVEPLRVCLRYKPMLGQGRKGGILLEEFQRLYRSDPFYSWMGLDSPLMYAAHKAAGGMTSIYRQIGIGCQWIFQQVLRDALGLTPEQSNWSYTVPKPDGDERTLALDGRIELAHVRKTAARNRVADWLADAKKKVQVPTGTAKQIRGVVFEVRQGYKSKDSKRQNADIANASNAYAHLYLPVLALFSTQIDGDVAERYAAARWLMLVGTAEGSSTESTYTFCRNVLGYALDGFFERSSGRVKTELEAILKSLLSPSSKRRAT